MPDDITILDYRIWLYRDGNLTGNIAYEIGRLSGDEYTTIKLGAFKSYNTNTHSSKLVNNTDSSVWESGTYTYRIKVSDGTTADDDLNSVELSSEYEYTKPTSELATPINVHWDDTQIGLLKWDEVENADYYQVKVYELNASENTYNQVAGGYVYNNSCNYREYFIDDAEYVAVVSAISCKDFIQSDYSEEVTYKKGVIDDSTSDDNPTGGDDNSTDNSGATDNDDTVDNSGATDNDGTVDNSGTTGDNSSSVSNNTTSSDSSSTTTSVSAESQPKVGNSSGWDAVSDEVKNALADTAAGTTSQAVVSVDLKDTDTVPATAISAIAGKEVILSVSVGENTYVNIDGSSLDAKDVAEVKITTAKSANGATSLGVRAQNLDLQKNIIIYSNAGKSKVGSAAVLYFQNADGSLLAFRNSIVFENGYTAFITPFVNANYEISIE